MIKASKGIWTDESPHPWIIIPRPQEHQPDLPIHLLARERERIATAIRLAADATEDIVGVPPHDLPAAIAQRPHAAQGIGVVGTAAPVRLHLGDQVQPVEVEGILVDGALHQDDRQWCGQVLDIGC